MIHKKTDFAKLEAEGRGLYGGIIEITCWYRRFSGNPQLGFYYVDKTKLIEQLLESWGKVNLFTRPRRFGKTLNMSMLRYFFEMSEQNRTLFGGLYISKNKQFCVTDFIECLFRHYGQKTIILIDEYDVPLDKAYQHGYYREMTALIRGIIWQGFEDKQFLQFAVLTGCLRVSKESIFTGLNNFKVLSITDSRFDEQFGFTEKERQGAFENLSFGQTIWKK